MPSVARLLVASSVAWSPVVISRVFFLWRRCVQWKHRLKVLVAQNTRTNQAFRKKGSELDGSDIKLRLRETTSRTPRSERNSQQDGGGAFVGIRRQTNTAKRRVSFSLEKVLANACRL